MYEDFEVEFAGQAFKCVDKGFAENERVDVVIRPEDIIVGDYETSPISGEVESVIFKGVHYEITVMHMAISGSFTPPRASQLVRTSA